MGSNPVLSTHTVQLTVGRAQSRSLSKILGVWQHGETVTGSTGSRFESCKIAAGVAGSTPAWLFGRLQCSQP